LPLTGMPGERWSRAASVNNTGSIVGTESAPFGAEPMGVYWADATASPVFLPDFGGIAVEPVEIGETGAMVGTTAGAGDRQVIAWAAPDAAPQPLAAPGGLPCTAAPGAAINASEQIVATCMVGGVTRAIYWPSREAPGLLLDMLGGTASAAGGMNDLGQMAGSVTRDGRSIPVIWMQEGSSIRAFELGIVSPGAEASALAINNTG